MGTGGGAGWAVCHQTVGDSNKIGTGGDVGVLAEGIISGQLQGAM